MVIVSKTDLMNIAINIQNKYSEYHGNCFEVSNEIVKKLRDININATTLEVSIGEAREVHYVVSVPSNQIKDINTDKGHTYIDAIIKQYSFENWKKEKQMLD